MDHTAIVNVFVFLVAACVVVPLMKRFHLSAILGYLIAGIAIGPFGFSVITHPDEILHFAEFGVVMMLFLIGLELDPAALWRLRRPIIGLGGLQVLLTTALIALIAQMLGAGLHASLAIGMALSLSSTAIVLQMMQEKRLLHTTSGEHAFAVLLFQDIAVIPMLLLIPFLALTGHTATVDRGLLSEWPLWASSLMVVAVIAAMVFGGRWASRHLFEAVARTGQREVFTAASLAVIVGVALLMGLLGLSPALGAFIAGLVLANSEYRHTLIADIEPFKGLLLGLFFISVGMGMNIDMLQGSTAYVLLLVAALVGLKALALLLLGYGFGLRGTHNAWLALALAQGGEFAFVLLQLTRQLAIIPPEQSELLTLVVVLSMAATPLLMLVNEKLIATRFMSVLPDASYDEIHSADNPVILAGYGRFGQVVGRFLRGQGVGVTVLEKDPNQIALLRKFGSQGYFGDASRLDLLEAAGAKKAKLLVVAVDDPDKSLEIVRLAKQHFPKLIIYARARNRSHAYELHKAGVDYFHRELFDSSLNLAKKAMKFLGADADLVNERARKFRTHDNKTLRDSFAFFEREPELVSFARQRSGELERILREDTSAAAPAEKPKRRRKKTS